MYSDTNTTYAEAIATMSDSLKKTLYGGADIGSVPAITDAQLLQILNGLQCSATRKALIQNALSLVGKVPYFWGGKSGPGWNEEWGTPKLVTSAGSASSGQLRPYGMDCSGFTDWVYKTTGLPSIGAGSANQWSNSVEISASELRPGDLGFKARPSEPGVNHVLMYVGIDPSSGKQMWVHCSSSAGGVVLNAPGYVRYYRRPVGIDLESEDVPAIQAPGEVDYTMRVEVTHYCACAKCCGKNANGMTASGKQAAPGMVAMSSHYPFGTKLSINGVVYTVEVGAAAALNPTSLAWTSLKQTIRLLCEKAGTTPSQLFISRWFSCQSLTTAVFIPFLQIIRTADGFSAGCAKCATLWKRLFLSY